MPILPMTLTEFFEQYRFWLLGLSGSFVLIALMLFLAHRLKTNLQTSVLAAEEREQSRVFLQTVIDGFPEALVVINRDYSMALTNRMAKELAGGHDFATICVKCPLFLCDDASSSCSNKDNCPITKAMDTQQTVTLEHIHQNISGHRQILEIIATPILDEKGESIQVIQSFRDVTKRRKAEEELRRNEAFLNTLLDAIPLPVFFKDADRRYLGVNRAFESFVGITKEQLVGKRVYEIHPTKQAKTYDQKDKALLQNGGSQKYESKILTHHGQLSDIVLRKAAFHDNQGDVIGLIGTITDVTEGKRHERVLAARLRLSKFSDGHTVSDLLRRCLDEAEQLTESKIGFFHFLEADQQTLSLQMWSTNTVERMCRLEHSNTHYPVGKAGVWVDCIHKRKAVIHNDYPNLTHRNGFPEGHAPVIRELVVPVFRGEHIVAIIGVGNKERNYTEQDVKTVSDIADMAWDIVLRKRAEDALRESEEQYRTMMESMVDSAYICAKDFRVEYMNPAMVDQVGHDGSGELCYEAIHGFSKPCPGCIHEKVMKGEQVTNEYSDAKNNKTFHVSSSPIFHMDGTISKLTVFRDITEIKTMQTQLQQAQKMEAIGALASGIAHDFNNLLFPVMGYAEMLKEDLHPEDPKYDFVDQILKAASRSRDLVSQILSFSRQNDQQLIALKLQPIIKEALKFLRSSIPTTIDIRHRIDSDCGMVFADPTQIHQIIINLCTNSLHALEGKEGRIDVTLHQVFVKEPQRLSVNLSPGKYARIIVSDTGHGINSDIINKVFDPYFTTKEVGKGTGLGLSVVLGIVRNCMGDIRISSSPGSKTTVEIYLPIVKNAVDTSIENDVLSIKGGSESILVVDDEKEIVRMFKQMLERLGYGVSPHTSSMDALTAFKINPHDFDLILSDMTMPNKTGIQLAMEAKQIRSDIPILICTGFSDQIDEGKSKAAGIQGILKKPIISHDLARAIREVLDSRNKSIPTNN